MVELLITNLEEKYFNEVKEFTDKHIGQGYYSLEQISEICEKSKLNNQNCSFLLFQNGKMAGIRLSYMPGKWSKGKGMGGLTPSSWTESLETLGYFQSLFILPELTGQNWGAFLSSLSLQELTKAGAKGVLTHSWLESPHNSSRRYLEKLGFKIVTKHPLYWNKIDYDCPRCGKPCVCTAGEMIKYLGAK